MRFSRSAHLSGRMGELEMTENVTATSENAPVYLPEHDRYHDDEIHRILSSVSTIAMVGASALWRRPSYYAMKYLQKKGYRVIPINPTRVGEQILGETVYASLSHCPAPVDMIDVFQSSERAYAIAEEAIANKERLGASILWMQLTVRNDSAAELAEAASFTVIMNRCPKIEFGRLSGELGWSGINSGVISSKRLRPIRK